MQVTPEIRREFAKTMINRMCDYAIETFGLPQEFKNEMKTRFNTKGSRGRSHAGYCGMREKGRIVYRPYIYLFMGGARFNSEEPKGFMEYDAIAKDAEIGTVANVHWSVALTALIAHEISHVIDAYGKMGIAPVAAPPGYEALLEPRVNSVFNRGHGARWQYVYRVMRRAFVNKNLIGTIDGVDEVKQTVQSRESKPKRTRKQRFVTKRISGNFVAYFKNEGDIEPVGWIKTQGYHYGSGYVPIKWDGQRRNVLLRVETLREAREALGLYN